VFKTGKWDLVKWTNKPGDRMQRAVKALQEKVPEMPFIGGRILGEGA
jgi:hypothetical protein